MLAHDGIVFAEGHFFCGVARVFLGDVKKAGVSCAEQLDFDSGWLRHDPFLQFEIDYKKQRVQMQLRSQMRAVACVRLQSQAILCYIMDITRAIWVF